MRRSREFVIEDYTEHHLGRLKFIHADRTDKADVRAEWSDGNVECEKVEVEYNYEAILATINKYEYIELVSFHFTFIGESLLVGLMQHKGEIEEIMFDAASVDVSKQIFLQFCKRFKSIVFNEASLPLNLFTDQVLRQVTNHTTFCLGLSQYNYFHCTIDRVPGFTDDTLYAMVEDDMRSEFSFAYFYSNCTIRGIEYMLKDAYFHGFEIKSWNFGFLKKSEAVRAEKFMNSTNSTNAGYTIRLTCYPGQFNLYQVFAIGGDGEPCATFYIVLDEPAFMRTA